MFLRSSLVHWVAIHSGSTRATSAGLPSVRFTTALFRIVFFRALNFAFLITQCRANHAGKIGIPKSKSRIKGISYKVFTYYCGMTRSDERGSRLIHQFFSRATPASTVPSMNLRESRDRIHQRAPVAKRQFPAILGAASRNADTRRK
jgi:hypothetical protein